MTDMGAALALCASDLRKAKDRITELEAQVERLSAPVGDEEARNYGRDLVGDGYRVFNANDVTALIAARYSEREREI